MLLSCQIIEIDDQFEEFHVFYDFHNVHESLVVVDKERLDFGFKKQDRTRKLNAIQHQEDFFVYFTMIENIFDRTLSIRIVQ